MLGFSQNSICREVNRDILPTRGSAVCFAQCWALCKYVIKYTEDFLYFSRAPVVDHCQRQNADHTKQQSNPVMNSHAEDLWVSLKQVRIQSWLKVSHSVAKGDFPLTKVEETDLLGHSKYTGRDQRGKTGLQSYTRRNLKRLLLSRDGRDKSSYCCNPERLSHSLAAVALLHLPRPLPW